MSRVAICLSRRAHDAAVRPRTACPLHQLPGQAEGRQWRTGKPPVDAVVDVSFDVARQHARHSRQSGTPASPLWHVPMVGYAPCRGSSLVFTAKLPSAGARPAWPPHRHVAMTSRIYRSQPVATPPTVQSLITEPLSSSSDWETATFSAGPGGSGAVGLPADSHSASSASALGGPGETCRRRTCHRARPKAHRRHEPRLASTCRPRPYPQSPVAQLQAQFGPDICIISHNLAVVRHVSDRTAISVYGSSGGDRSKHSTILRAPPFLFAALDTAPAQSKSGQSTAWCRVDGRSDQPPQRSTQGMRVSSEMHQGDGDLWCDPAHGERPWSRPHSDVSSSKRGSA